MIEKHIKESWEEAPSRADFEKRFGDLLEELKTKLTRCAAMLGEKDKPLQFYDDITDIFLLAPALPNVTLNHKICVENGLPMHPSEYVDLAKEKKDVQRYSNAEKHAAQQFFLGAIAAARNVYRLNAEAVKDIDAMQLALPEHLNGFVYTNERNKYAWRASEPAAVRILAEDMKKAGMAPDLIVGAAHGSICPGIMLANMLGCGCYFIRYTLFKRQDQEPIISELDRRFLDKHRDRRVLAFDEDVTMGKTLHELAESLKPFFPGIKTGTVLRYGYAKFRPDFTGKEFYE